MFRVCPACDSGRSYCGEACQQEKRTQVKRAARARHQASPEGRLDHRDAQRRYRARCRESKSVTDLGGRKVDKSVAVAPRMEPSAEIPVEPDSRRGSVGDVIEERQLPLRCAFCWRESRWVRREFKKWRRAWPEASAG